jgi:hypothetical protein
VLLQVANAQLPKGISLADCMTLNLHGYIYVSRVFVSETLCQAIQEGSGT